MASAPTSLARSISDARNGVLVVAVVAAAATAAVVAVGPMLECNCFKIIDRFDWEGERGCCRVQLDSAKMEQTDAAAGGKEIRERASESN